jgi:5'-nucleotidase
MSQSESRPLILLVNDDGIDAPGLEALRSAVEDLGEILVVAPAVQRSATGHMVTIFRDLDYREVHRDGRLWGHSLDGMPADCVKLGALYLAKRRPDLLIAGINPGSNIGNNILYSGTVAAAREGAMLGVPSIAVSVDHRHWEDSSEPCRFETGALWARRTARLALRRGLPRGVYLNVNTPNLPPSLIQGAAVARQGRLMFIDEWAPRVEDGRVRAFANLGARMVGEGPEGGDEDDAVLRSGKVAVTPLHFDTTHHDSMDDLKTWDFNLPAT